MSFISDIIMDDPLTQGIAETILDAVADGLGICDEVKDVIESLGDIIVK